MSSSVCGTCIYVVPVHVLCKRLPSTPCSCSMVMLYDACHCPPAISQHAAVLHIANRHCATKCTRTCLCELGPTLVANLLSLCIGSDWPVTKRARASLLLEPVIENLCVHRPATQRWQTSTTTSQKSRKQLSSLRISWMRLNARCALSWPHIALCYSGLQALCSTKLTCLKGIT